MGVELSLDPATCPISAAGGVSKHKVSNHCNMLLPFKVKTFNNSNYTVNVVYRILDVATTYNFVITRIKGKPQPDHLTIQYASVAPDQKDPKASFATGKPVGEISGETPVKLSAVE